MVNTRIIPDPGSRIKDRRSLPVSQTRRGSLLLFPIQAASKTGAGQDPGYSRTPAGPGFFKNLPIGCDFLRLSANHPSGESTFWWQLSENVPFDPTVSGT
jgi:hypothetical protein